MSEAPENPQTSIPGQNGPQTTASGGTAAGPGNQPPQIQVDDSKATTSYANFCRVTGTPEEVLIDFGLNEHPFGAQSRSISVNQRIITNYYTAKRLLQVLQMTVQRYEGTFGVLETDVQRRVRSGAGRPPQSP